MVEIKHEIIINPFNDCCYMCKQRIPIHPERKNYEVYCGVFHKLLKRTLNSGELCRCSQCLKLDKDIKND